VKALPAGIAIVADTRYVVGAVSRNARVEFSGHAEWTRDAVSARVTMRVDWAVADENALYLLLP